MSDTYRVALLFSMSGEFGRMIWRGIQQYVKAHGHWVPQVFADYRPEAGKAVATWKPDGIISGTPNRKLLDSIRSSGIPIVCASIQFPELELPQVGLDDVSVGQLVADEYLRRGFRNLAFVGMHTPFSERRLRGYRRSADRAGVSVHTCISPGTSTNRYRQIARIEKQLCDFLRHLPKPAGLMACNDSNAAYVEEMCREEDLRVPEDVAIVGVDNDPLMCELAECPISSVQIPGVKLGYQAAELLDGLMHGEPAPNIPVLLEPLGIVTRHSSDTLVVDDPVISRAVAFMRANAAEPIGVDDIADEVAVSRRSLERKFHRKLERSVYSELMHIRIEMAKHLLLDTDLKLETIALQCGFSNSSRLCYAFRNAVGTTPKGYRRQAVPVK